MTRGRQQIVATPLTESGARPFPARADIVIIGAGITGQTAAVEAHKLAPERSITLITDQATREIAASLAREIESVGARHQAFVLEELAPRVEDFVPESEQRYFVLLGVGYAASQDVPVPEIVQRCGEWLPSKFFSVDVARRPDGELRVVELGDGQVSDLVGWSPEAFAALWVRSGCG